jgi:hypothetical protein
MAEDQRCGGEFGRGGGCFDRRTRRLGGRSS